MRRAPGQHFQRIFRTRAIGDMRQPRPDRLAARTAPSRRVRSSPVTISRRKRNAGDDVADILGIVEG